MIDAHSILEEYCDRVIPFDEDAIHVILVVLKAIGKQYIQSDSEACRASAIVGLPFVSRNTGPSIRQD